MLEFVSRLRTNRPGIPARKSAGRPASAFNAFAPEPLEARKMLSANPFGQGTDSHDATTVVYVESNNAAPGKNAVLGYRRDPATGALTELSAGPFFTGGTGFANGNAGLGPDDSDHELATSPDGRFLFAVNQGSNDVSVFRVHSNGELTLVGGKPFSSGGVQPVSIGVQGDNIYVTNRGDELQGSLGTIPGSYVGFHVRPNGSLTAIPGANVTLPQGLSAAQSLVSPDGKFLFGDNFTPPPLLNLPLANTIDPFVIGKSGQLIPAPGGPVGAPVTPPLVLGLANNPNLPIIYAGLTAAGRVGVFSYDSTGAVTFRTSVPDAGNGACWTTVSADGKFLYVSNSGSDDVGVYSLADPLNPVQIQEFNLGGPKQPAGDTTPGNKTVDFQLALDPSGKNLFVVNHETADAPGFSGGNQLHALSVAADGTVSEPSASPVIFSESQVPSTAHPQGVVVLSLGGRENGGESNPFSPNAFDGDKSNGNGNGSNADRPSLDVDSIVDHAKDGNNAHG
ncbi:MAG TPA: beta-propeller fold lactonase family protein [Tepidisphaeraceae bacterium]|nr:beta-propeller fold lactonase family protein [Tepidisphaeraceae bacterium]